MEQTKDIPLWPWWLTRDSVACLTALAALKKDIAKAFPTLSDEEQALYVKRIAYGAWE